MLVKKVYILFFVAVSLFLFTSTHAIAKQAFTTKSLQFELHLEHLLINQAFHERHLTLTIKTGQMDEAKVLEIELIENTRAIAEVLTPYYGKMNAYLFSNLLAANSGAIGEYRLAAFKADNEAKKVAADRMNSSSDAMASFLSAPFPKNMGKDTLGFMFMENQKHQRAVIDAVADGDFEAERKHWNELEAGTYKLAEAIARGLANEFPNKF